MKTIDKLKKFAEGGKVRKYEGGGTSLYEKAYQEAIDSGSTPAQAEAYARQQQKQQTGFSIASDVAGSVLGESAANSISGVQSAFNAIDSGQWNPKKRIKNKNGEDITEKVGKGLAVGSAVVTEGVKLIDAATMGDKNFGAQSQAIDDAVHGVSGALMKSGNPYAMAAAAALEGANFLTKAGGQTVQGFDVDISSSGYGDLGHMESSSSRDFSAALGPLGSIFTGVNKKKMQAKLAKRNQQAMLAMNAANIANDQEFEQEARMNSIQNTITNNQIALAGGLDTSLLGG